MSQSRFTALEIEPISGPVKNLEIHGTVHDSLDGENPGKAIIYCEGYDVAVLVTELLNQRWDSFFEKEN